MKLALIRRQFAAAGGAELYLQRLLRALVQRGHQAHLFAESWTGQEQGVTFHPVHAGGFRATRPLRFASAVQAQIARQRFDCVFSLERTAAQDVYRAGDGVHRVWLEQRRRFAPAWKRPFVGWGAFHRNLLRLEASTFHPGHTGRIIVNSDMVRREILQHFDFPADRIHLVRNGIATRRFRDLDRAAARARFGLPEDAYVLLFVGSGWERKGLKFLLEAVRLLHVGPGGPHSSDNIGPGRGAATRASLCPPPDPEHLRLLVVGKGKIPARVPPRVHFAGPIDAVEDAYAAADLFVFLPIYEPSANVVCEALAAGLPVVTTVQNGASELLEETINGTVLRDPADTRHAAQAIGYWWSRRGYAPPIRTETLSLERNVAETMAVLELAASERSR
jgi:UDP-glucose:(heptosyl)LPS alpha-1,3-glucosyltransferase